MKPLNWIKVYGDLPGHPKVEALERATGIPRVWTHLVELWLWTAKYRSDGDLSDVDDETIYRKAGLDTVNRGRRPAGWDNRAQRFVGALISCGWMCDMRTLHEWKAEYGGIEREREACKLRKQKQRDRAKAHGAYVSEPMSRVTPAGLPPGSHSRVEESREEKKEGGREREALEQPAVDTSPDPHPPDKESPTQAASGSLEHVLAELVDGAPRSERWAKRYAALDGVGPRPSWRETAERAWEHHAGKPKRQRIAAVEKWLAEDAGKAAIDAKRQAAADISLQAAQKRAAAQSGQAPGGQDPLKLRWMAAKGRSGADPDRYPDPGPFEAWKAAGALDPAPREDPTESREPSADFATLLRVVK